MSTLSWDGIYALVLLAPAFYFVHQIPVYLGLCAAIIGAYAYATWASVDWEQPSEWIVTTLGLMLCSFGLLIVRVMLIRSVSLQLLGELSLGRTGSTDERLGGRPNDMRAFGLIRSRDDNSELTPFGRAVGGVVALLYTVFGVGK